MTWCALHAPTFSRYHLVVTARTAEQIQAATGLSLEQKLASSLGGTIQIAAEVANSTVLAVIFLVEPFAAPSEPTLDVLLHPCNIHNVAIATNLATAEAGYYQLNRMCSNLRTEIPRPQASLNFTQQFSNRRLLANPQSVGAVVLAIVLH